jgi:hypothetical protein
MRANLETRSHLIDACPRSNGFMMDAASGPLDRVRRCEDADCHGYHFSKQDKDRLRPGVVYRTVSFKPLDLCSDLTGSDR